MSLTTDRLHELLEYNQITGVFIWRTRRNVMAVAGEIAGYTSNGYVKIEIDSYQYFAHRLAWLYIHGEFPSKQIDHIDGNRSNNRIVNLRLASQSQNSANMRRHSRNTSGFKGVHWHKRKQCWEARITVNSVQHHLGYFDESMNAHAAYCHAAIKNFGEFARAE